MIYSVILIASLIIFAASFVAKYAKNGRDSDPDQLAIKTHKLRQTLRYTAVVAVIVPAIILSVFIVQQGEIGFLKTFGKISNDTYWPGLNFVSPFSSHQTENIKRRSINYTGVDTAKGLTANKVVMDVDVTIPWMITASAAPILRSKYGKNWNLINPASRKAIRDCLSALPWEDATSESGRTKMSECIPLTIKKIVVADLISSGVNESIAQSAFIFPDALVRKMVPANQRILDSIAEEQAAVVDLRRQETLTKIAKEEANRRANEGSGIKLMMAELPKDFTVTEMVAMIQANAAKTNAEAFMKAVEGSNPNITVITGAQSGVPITAKAN